MIEKMYEMNLKKALPEIKKLDFPGVIRASRDLMGLKQYACSDYLGMENSRYKKLESGKFTTKTDSWERSRLECFFKLPRGILKEKEDEFLAANTTVRREVCNDAWGREKSMGGTRPKIVDIRKSNN